MDMKRTQVELAASTWGISVQVRKALARFVLESRSDLEDDFRRQLAAVGVYPDRLQDTGRSLTPVEQAAREAASAVVDRTVQGGICREDAFATFVRDSAFTFLNRIVGLRCLEERGMLLVDGNVETAIRQDERLRASSLYFRVRNELAADASPRDVWRETLHRAFQAVSKHVGLLFDSDSEFGRLLPLQPTLARIVDGLNHPAITSETWGDDEVLGWIYQYYNAAEKNAVYDKLGRGGKIEQPEELAAATCLYTERYMVDFLLQNTLGALWLLMHPDTRLKDKWSYYVAPPDGEPIRIEDNVPHRLRELTLLDPACGSGHFLARAFDLLADMYEEEGLENPKVVPSLIIGQNLHGIDIDLRAVQISALRLYLKGCELAGPDFRPQRVNLVSADIVLPGIAPQDLLDRFRGDDDVQALVTAAWSDLKDASKLGSLLHPEHHVDLLLARRRGKGDTLEYQDDVAWERFKLELLDSVRVEFDKEAQSGDIGRRLFGQNVAKGLGLVEALSRRYDVVVTNPPYAGTTNLDDPVKNFIDREYKYGKRDLYAAFILRNIEFARPGAFIGMVTQQSWLFLRSYAKLRGQVLNGATVETLAHLGPRGFEEISGEVVNVALFTLRAQHPMPGHRITAFRLVGPKAPAEKDRLLRLGIVGDASGVVFRPEQADLQAIPETPFVYWLRPRFFELLKSDRRLSDIADVCVGLQTSDNEQFIRCAWEVPFDSSNRWFRLAKGGRYQKWAGLEQLVVDWEHQGARIKQYIVKRYPYMKGNPGWLVRDEDHYFEDGVTYSLMARGSLGARVLSGSIFDNASPSIFVRKPDSPIALTALLNARAVSYLLRVTTQDLKFREGYVARLPVPSQLSEKLAAAGRWCIELKREMVSSDPLEWSFGPAGKDGGSLGDYVSLTLVRQEVVASTLHSLEAWIETLGCEAYALGADDVRAVVEETGMPAGWNPLIEGYPGLPEGSSSRDLPPEFEDYLESRERSKLSVTELNSLKRHLSELYRRGPGAPVDEEEPADSESEEASLGAHIPIPVETFIEELSSNLRVHPISLCKLIAELREDEALVCPSEVKRAFQEEVSVTLLRLLGYRWPAGQTHSAQRRSASEQAFASLDGIIPLVQCDEQPVAAQRLKAELARRFGEDGATRSLEEFRVWLGRDLDNWLERDFFRWHIQQFKQRPIAWHLTSSVGTFQVFLLYQRLSRDTLRRLRDVYAGGLVNRLKAELERAQGRKDARTAEELRSKIEDVDDFRDRILAVEEGRELRNRIRCRWKGEEKDGRPGPYAPDLNDGVKVNVRPFQETGLLAREVIKKW